MTHTRVIGRQELLLRPNRAVAEHDLLDAVVVAPELLVEVDPARVAGETQRDVISRSLEHELVGRQARPKDETVAVAAELILVDAIVPFPRVVNVGVGARVAIEAVVAGPALHGVVAGEPPQHVAGRGLRLPEIRRLQLALAPGRFVAEHDLLDTVVPGLELPVEVDPARVAGEMQRDVTARPFENELVGRQARAENEAVAIAAELVLVDAVVSVARVVSVGVVARVTVEAVVPRATLHRLIAGEPPRHVVGSGLRLRHRGRLQLGLAPDRSVAEHDLLDAVVPALELPVEVDPARVASEEQRNVAAGPLENELVGGQARAEDEAV